MKFRFVDKILEVVPHRSIQGIKTLSLEEYFTVRALGARQHFPPTLMAEALFQLGNFLIFKSFGDKLGLLTVFRHISIDRPLVPGESMHMQVALSGVIDDTVRLDGVGHIDGQVAIEGSGCLAKLVDLESLYPPDKFARLFGALCH